jgi:hypothetical protein
MAPAEGDRGGRGGGAVRGAANGIYVVKEEKRDEAIFDV